MPRVLRRITRTLDCGCCGDGLRGKRTCSACAVFRDARRLPTHRARAHGSTAKRRLCRRSTLGIDRRRMTLLSGRGFESAGEQHVAERASPRRRPGNDCCPRRRRGCSRAKPAAMHVRCARNLHRRRSRSAQSCRPDQSGGCGDRIRIRCPRRASRAGTSREPDPHTHRRTPPRWPSSDSAILKS